MDLSKIKLDFRLLLLFLAVALAGEVVWAVLTLSSPTAKGKGLTVSGLQASPASGATMVTLTAPKSSVAVGEKFSVSIEVLSAKPTDGADIIMTFDPTKLTVVRNGATDSPVITGSMYSDYPLNSIDETLGKVFISGVSSSPSGVVPNGTFGTVVFQAKSAGKSSLSLDFTPGSTVDTNVIESRTAKDLLEKVNNLELEIKQ